MVLKSEKKRPAVFSGLRGREKFCLTFHLLEGA